MTVGGGFRRLTRMLRRIERGGWSVRNVRSDGGDGLREGNAICAIVDCHWRPAGRLRRNGGTEVTPLRELGAGSSGVEVETLTVADGAAGEREATLRVRVEIDDEPGDDVPELDRTRPLHRDPERLESLYRRHGSFAEIAEAVPEDVSAETIRRYTIEHDIHQPGGRGPRDETAEEDASVAPVLADGNGLPEDMEMDAFVELVEEANTLYDVQRQLGLEREEAAELLARCDLLDLVVGRIDRAGDREAKREAIEGRLREIHP